MTSFFDEHTAHFRAVSVRWALSALPRCDLSQLEVERARRFRSRVDAEAFVASRQLLKVLVAICLREDPSRVVIEQRCISCGATDHGKPSVLTEEPINVSLSRSRNWIAAGVAPTEIGVDVEGADSDQALQRVSARVLTPEERLQVVNSSDPNKLAREYWVRKEALIKVGFGSLARMDLLDVGPDMQVPDRAANEYKGWRFIDRSQDGMSSVAVVKKSVDLKFSSGWKGVGFAVKSDTNHGKPCR